MMIKKEPNGYQLELSDADFAELQELHSRIFHVFTPSDTVILKLSKPDLSAVNALLMDRIANDTCNNLDGCLRVHLMIDEYVDADSLHEGYPDTWPWTGAE